MQDIRTSIITFIVLATVFILLLLIFVIIILFLYQKRHVTHKRDVEDLKSEYENTLLSSALEIKEQTFQNISREIHDNIGLTLTLAKLNLNTINWNENSHIQSQVFNSIEALSKAISDLSQLSKSLHTDYIKEQGLLKALEGELKKIEKTGIIQQHLQIIGIPVYMNDHKELVIFRIIQEVLHNSIKHGQASSIYVLFKYHDTYVNIKVVDNGRGFDLSQNFVTGSSGTGLLNIKKRALSVQSKCEIKSEPGKGTVVKLSIPYH